jgi:hypothetical protein
LLTGDEKKEKYAPALSGMTDAEPEEVSAGDLSRLKLELLRDRSNGPSRVLLLSALRRLKDPAVLRVLEELAGDPDLAVELARWGRFRKH